MAEPIKPFSFAEHTIKPYAARGNELRFYADQRFKIATAFLVTNGLLENVAKDHRKRSG